MAVGERTQKRNAMEANVELSGAASSRPTRTAGYATRSPSTVCVSESKSVREGLENMLTAAIGDHGYYLASVDVSVALLVIEAAKRAEDRDVWYPRGKWATVQAMQDVTERELRKMFDGA